jgi:hypothetical protein
MRRSIRCERLRRRVPSRGGRRGSPLPPLPGTLPVVKHAAADPGGPGRRSVDAPVEGRIAPVVLGASLSLGLLLVYGAWEYAFGHLHDLAEHAWWAPEMTGPRIALTIILLIGFLVGTNAHGRRAIVRDLEDLAPLLQGGSGEVYAALLREARGSAWRRGGWIGSLVVLPIGLLVVTSRRPGVPYLLSEEPWSHDLVLALAFNALLFAIMGGIAVQGFQDNQFFGRIESRLGPVDLLRPQALAPFARRGLRNAFLWIGGSSIASFIFVNQDFSWIIGLVLVGTLLLGTAAFLQPVRGLRRRIHEAKQAELECVRTAIRQARDELLDHPGVAGENARMPGLLAYEQRIAAVPEWPLATPQIARFGLVVAIGLGSWLGGAVVDHLVEVLWR